jgi:hypothetical protein
MTWNEKYDKAPAGTLHYMYHDLEMTLEEMGEAFGGISRQAVRQRMVKHQVPRNTKRARFNQ